MIDRDPRRIQTLHPGETVTLHLRGRQVEAINAWVGRVIDVDAVAVRIAATGSRFSLTWSPASGERVIPWQHIAHVAIEAAAESVKEASHAA